MSKFIWYKDRGFHDKPIEGGVKIAVKYWERLILEQSNGAEIQPDAKGYPVAVKHEPDAAEVTRDICMSIEAFVDSDIRPNDVSIDGFLLHLDKEGRAAIYREIERLKRHNETDILLWTLDTDENPHGINIPLPQALDMLDEWEAHTKEVYNVAQRHKQNIATVAGIPAKRKYNYKTGYPTRPEFVSILEKEVEP